MSYCVPVAQVDVYDPRYLGGVTKMGWGGDFLSDAPGTPYPRWQHIGTEVIPEWQAIAPMGQPEWEDMILSEWEVVSGLWDDKSRPETAPRTRFLHAYGGTVGAVSEIVSRANYRPQWVAKLRRHVPPAGTPAASECDISITMEADGETPSWRIVIPTRSSEHKYPRLLKSAIYGAAEVEVSRLAVDTTAAQDAEWQDMLIWCEQTLNAWIIGLRTNSAASRWFWADNTVDVCDTSVTLCRPGPLRIISTGQQLMVAVAEIKYPWLCEAYPRTYYSINADIAAPSLAWLADADARPKYQAVVVAPSGEVTYRGRTLYTTGSACTIDIELGDNNSIAPRLTFTSDEKTRAVCGVVSLIIPPEVGANTYATAKYTTAANATFREGDTIEYTRRASWQGTEFSLPLRDADGSIDIGLNDVAILSAAHQTTESAPPLVVLATGYVTKCDRERNGRLETESPVTVSDYWAARMPRKSMIYMPSFGRMAFGDAFRIIGNRLGFAEARISVAAALEDVPLPGSQVIGAQSLFWDEKAKPDVALNLLCSCVGAFCGITPEGELFAKANLTYSGTPDYTLDDDALDTDARILSIIHRRDPGEFANNVFAITGTEGYRRIAWARDKASEDTTTDADFIGDQFVEIETLETVTAAQTLADRTLATRGHFSDIVEWELAVANAALMPGKFVRVQASNVGIATNAVYYITEEHGTITPTMRDAGGWKQRFVMVKIQ